MDQMELDAMVDDEYQSVNMRKRNGRRVWKLTWIRASAGCFLLAFISLAAAFAIFHLAPNLTSKFNGKSIRVISGSFRNEYESKGTSCEDALSGNALELSIIPAYARQCTSREDTTCKSRISKQLRTMFHRLSTFALPVQLNDDDSNDINIKLCNVESIDDYREEPIVSSAPTQRPRRRRTTTTTVPVEVSAEVLVEVPIETPVEAPAWAPVPERTRHYSTYQNDPYMTSKKGHCALCLNRIGLVQTNGDHGSDVQDDIRTYNDNGHYRRAFILTVFEDSSHKLNVQLDCVGHLGEHLSDSPCSNSLSVHVWIDYNDNGYDDGKGRLLRRSWPTDGTSTGTYELDVYIPIIDDINTRVGQHKMIITLSPSHEYQTQCGAMDYKEQRDYSVNIVRKARHIGNSSSDNSLYLQKPTVLGRIQKGESGFDGRDDLARNTLTNDHRNQHHLAVTLYEHTIYLLRIQLDCPSQLKTELTETGCNLAQDVNVFLDLNDDGRYDSAEIGAPHRWPVTSYLPDGIYDLQVHIPYLDDRYVTSRQHRMRIVVAPSDHYRRICGKSDYTEERNYYVNIISKTSFIPPNNLEATYAAYDNITCTPQVGKIILVVMGGEHRTQIRDDPTTNALLGTSAENQQHLSIMLREDITYLLQNNCHLPHEVSAWIDLDDNGRYDESESATSYRWPLTSYLPQGVYDLQIVVPVIDGELGGPYLQLSDRVCTQSHGRVVLVIMAGEQGTEIRDNTPNNTIISKYQNRHHMAVTLLENTNYRIRIQLDCEMISSRGPLRSDCNLMQDVNILIDQNNDNTYQENESVTPNRWPLRSSIPSGLYDYEIHTPPSGNAHYRGNEVHHMRIIVKPSSEYETKCGHTNYAEIRDYSLNIIPRTNREY
ncbi:hypothetical protein I4U23_012290 [Adineta vaga]|nr:hypothetical protein I4U23_012290 [Adineta vaga]